MRRRIRPRPLSLVILAHVLVLGFVLVERRFRPERTAPEQLVYILPITSPPAPEIEETAEVRPVPMPKSRLPVPSPVVREPPNTEFETAPITQAAPPIDWQRELELSARNFARPAEPEKRYRSLNARPKALELPQPSEGPVSGEVVMLPNGDKTVSFDAGEKSVVCNSPQVALDEAFSVWAKFRPPRCTVKGGKRKDRIPEPERRAYLGPPLPLGSPMEEESPDAADPDLPPELPAHR